MSHPPSLDSSDRGHTPGIIFGAKRCKPQKWITNFLPEATAIYCRGVVSGAEGTLETTRAVRSSSSARTLLFLVVSVALLTRALYMALAKRQRPLCVRALVVGSTPLIVGFWAFRLGFWF